MGKIYKIQFNKRYLKDLQKIPKADRQQICDDVSSLSTNPRPDGYKKLKNSKESLYRIRCGNYRVVYIINDDVLIIVLVEPVIAP